MKVSIREILQCRFVNFLPIDRLTVLHFPVVRGTLPTIRPDGVRIRGKLLGECERTGAGYIGGEKRKREEERERRGKGREGVNNKCLVYGFRKWQYLRNVSIVERNFVRGNYQMR